MQHLSETMTAQEFGQHYALECYEPVEFGVRLTVAQLLAATANGQLSKADKTMFTLQDFAPTNLWAALHEGREDESTNHDDDADEAQAPTSVQDILTRARLAGMQVQ